MPTCLRRHPQQQRSRDRVDLILDSAALLLASSGPNGTTITAVAEQTGLPTSSIYDYVLSERELIGAVAERGLDRIHQDLVDEVGEPASTADLRASLTACLHLFLERYQTDPGLREALAFVDADPQLMQINLADTRRNADVIHAAIVGLDPGADVASAVLLLTHLSGSLAGLAARVTAVEADDLVAQFERLLLLLLSGP